MSKSSTAPKMATKWDALPPEVVQKIASRLRPNDQSILRAVSKGTRKSVADPFQKERAKINRLVELFKSAQIYPERQPKPGKYSIYALDDGNNVLWYVVLTYENKIFEAWKELTILKFREDKQDIEGAIRMDFTRKRVVSYKAADKIWLIAFLFTLMEWMGDYQKYKAHLSNKAFMRTEQMSYFEFGVGIVELPTPVWKTDLNREHIMEIARLIWTRKRHEDKDFADLMKATARLRYPNKPPRATQAATVTAYDEGRAATLAMRAASKKREAFLKKGMLGHKEAVARFLPKKNSKSKS